MILLTGGSGFLGKTITSELSSESIITLGRTNSDIICDLSLIIPDLPYAEIVVHAAGKAHFIPKSESDKLKFFEVNVQGTKNLLKGLEQNLPNSFVYISTVAVYGRDRGSLLNEETPLLATDSYGKSKIEAEKIVQAWCKKNEVICTVLRLPLIAGPNPPGNLGSMIDGIKKGYYFNIGGGIARKSIVLANDIAKIIFDAAKIGGTYNLTDRDHPTFHELANLISSQLNVNSPKNMPKWLGLVLAKVGDLLGTKAPINSRKLSKITSDLTFDDQKAVNCLNWNPNKVLDGLLIK